MRIIRNMVHRSLPYLLASVGLAVIVAIASTMISSNGQVMASGSQLEQSTNQSDAPTATNTVFLPIVARDAGPTAYRIGYGATTSPITRYSDIRSLMAGWYVDWTARAKPALPSGIEYVQIPRVHQKLACGDRFNKDRNACPYAQPLTYEVYPNINSIKSIATANKGALWTIGNEMDRLDFCNIVNGQCVGSIGQDEILPETYAQAYHDIYTAIKSVDPSAKVGIGGLIQATPLRLQWLTIAWDTYKQKFGSDMPVDVWNIHNFVLREVKGEYGAEIPPGLPGNPTQGEYVNDDSTHISQEIFDKQIRAMRQWMKDRGQQQKPLVVTEYGVLYDQCVKKVNGNCTIDLSNEQTVHDFMLWTFDYFLSTKDCNLGYGTDDCRLVQRWLWFSLDHVATQSNGKLSYGANPHTSFYDSATLAMRPAGQKFKEYVQSHFAQLEQ